MVRCCRVAVVLLLLSLCLVLLLPSVTPIIALLPTTSSDSASNHRIEQTKSTGIQDIIEGTTQDKYSFHHHHHHHQRRNYPGIHKVYINRHRQQQQRLLPSFQTGVDYFNSDYPVERDAPSKSSSIDAGSLKNSLSLFHMDSFGQNTGQQAQRQQQKEQHHRGKPRIRYSESNEREKYSGQLRNGRSDLKWSRNFWEGENLRHPKIDSSEISENYPIDILGSVSPRGEEEDSSTSKSHKKMKLMIVKEEDRVPDDFNEPFENNYLKQIQNRKSPMTTVITQEPPTCTEYIDSFEPPEPPGECWPCGKEINKTKSEDRLRNQSLAINASSETTTVQDLSKSSCSSFMSLASLTSMVYDFTTSENQQSNNTEMEINEKPTENPKMLDTRQFKSTNDSGVEHCQQCFPENNDSKETYLTLRSFSDENCCVCSPQDVAERTLQYCKKFPILRTLWPKAVMRRTCGGENVMPGKTVDQNESSVCIHDEALRHLVERDANVGVVLRQHARMMQRMDCADNFSVVHNCSSCSVSKVFIFYLIYFNCFQENPLVSS